MSATDHENPDYWRERYETADRMHRAEVRRREKAEAVELLTKSALELAFKRGVASGRCCRCGGETIDG